MATITAVAVEGATIIAEQSIVPDNTGTLVNVINADTSTATIVNAKVAGLVNLGTHSFSTYPTVIGTDVNATSTAAITAPTFDPSTTVNSLAGTTAGTIYYVQPFAGSGDKKIIVWFDGYENDTTTAQSITFPTAFASVADVTTNTSGLTLTATTTTLTITAPDTTTVYNGMAIVEGW